MRLIISRLNIYVMPITLFGYYLISFAVDDPEFSRTVTAPYRAVILGLNLILASLYVFKRKRKRKRKSITQYQLTKKNKLFLKLVLVFILMYSVRIFYSSYISLEDLANPPLDYILYWFLISLIPSLCFISLKEVDAKNHLLFCWLLLGSATFLGIRASQAANEYFGVSGRLAIAALNPISMGHAGVSFSLLSIFLWFNRKNSFLSRGKIKPLALPIILCSSLSGIYLALLASSRGPIISFIVCSMILISSYRINIKKLISYLIFGSGAIFILTAVSNQGASIVDRFQNSQDYSVDSIAGHATRGQLMRRSIELFFEHPLFGSGLEVVDLGSYTHNLVIESFMTTGFLGGIVFLSVYAYTFIKAIGIVKDNSCPWGWLALLHIQYATSALLSGTLYSTNTFWYLLAAILSLKNVRVPVKRKAFGATLFS